MEPADGSLSLAGSVGSPAAAAWPNLVREADGGMLGVEASGFADTEWSRGRSFRWTGGDARLLVPLDAGPPPAALAVDVLMTGPSKRLRISVDGCTLFDEPVQGRWSATFDLADCRLTPPDVEIVLLSDTHTPGGRDTRELGVAVSSIELRGAAAAP